MREIKTIILDPGHGGIDSKGKYTTAPAKMYEFPNGEVAYEGVWNRKYAGKLGELLEALGYEVVYTVEPTDATDITLDRRVKKANKYPAAESLFVSMHFNASENHASRGFSVYTTRGITNSDRLADFVAAEVEKWVRLVGAGNDVKLRFDNSDGDRDWEEDFYVLKKTKMPAILIEGLFFAQYNDFQMIQDESFMQAFCEAVVSGIQEYVQSN